MRSFHRLAVLALPLLGRVGCEEPPASPTDQTPSPSAIYANANDAFQDLLNALPEESLHVALNSLAHFRDGVFESVRHGVEHVHHEDPPLATKLIVAAVQDLKKRQAPSGSNSTIQSTPTPGRSSSAPESSSAAPPTTSAVVVPVQVTTTDEEGRTTVSSSEILSEPTASVAVPVTRTNSQGRTEVSTETKPAVILQTTNSAGQTFTTTSAVDFVPTSGQVLTKTNSQGSTFLTTYTPDGGKVSSIILITTTGSDGQQSVITSFTYVEPGAATGTKGNPSSTNTAKPGLQSGAAMRNGGAIEAVMVGGAVGGLVFFI